MHSCVILMRLVCGFDGLRIILPVMSSIKFHIFEDVGVLRPFRHSWK